MVFVEGEDYRALRRPGDDPAQFRSVVRLSQELTAPNSVIHQYRGENFTTSTWTDSVGNADMSLNGVSPSTLNGDRAASSDGVDDVGLVDGPQTLPANETFGIAMVYRSSDTVDGTNILGANSSDNDIFQLSDSAFFDGSNGEVILSLFDDNRNKLEVETQKKISDSDIHLICINKNGNSASDVAFYIDDMQTESPTLTGSDQGFDNANYNISNSLGFFARNTAGTIDRFKALDMPFIEFNSDPYSLDDRLNLLERAPGIPFDDTPSDVVNQYKATNFDADTQTWGDSA